MTDRTSPPLSTRKRPQQARSAQLVSDILTAAAQVLARDGAHHFTTARVAEKAGVSVGSLYQYFPNKAAILFRLQQEEWAETSGLLRDMLDDRSLAPPERLRAVTHAFVRSECEEAAMRIALDDAAPFYRDAPEAHEPRIRGTRVMQDFLTEALPGLDEGKRALAGELLAATMGAIGKRISERTEDPAMIAAWSDALADMLCAYLGLLGYPASRP
jgi:AcrR family transcriptional regulator